MFDFRSSQNHRIEWRHHFVPRTPRTLGRKAIDFGHGVGGEDGNLIGSLIHELPGQIPIDLFDREMFVQGLPVLTKSPYC